MARLLSARDVLWLSVVAVCNASLMPTLASSGTIILILWPITWMAFLWPQAESVMFLSRRVPGQGGIYRWGQETFGGFQGFLSAWCYWLNNVFYVPTLLYFIVATAPAILGFSTEEQPHPAMTLGISLVLLWLVALANIVGLQPLRILTQFGGIGAIVITAILVGLALKMGVSFVPDTADLSWSWSQVSVFGVMCLGLVGLELPSTMTEQIEAPHRTIAWAVRRAAVMSAAIYFVGSLVLVVSTSEGRVGALDGIVDAASSLAGPGVGWAVPLVASLAVLASLGAATAWFGGSARIFVAVSLDRSFPRAIARPHPRWGTPAVAFMLQGVCSSLVMIGSAAGSTNVEAYLVMLNVTVILQLIPYIYMHAAAFRLGLGSIRVWASLGILSTVCGILLAFVPPEQSASVATFVSKVVLGTALSVAAAAICYWQTRPTPGVTI